MAFRSRKLGRYTNTVSAPMSELNITPLIDVLLVLLVMLILSIPIATHQVQVDLPGPDGPVTESEQIALVVTDQDAILWNGQAVSGARLQQLLKQAAADPANPVIRFEPEANASYDSSVRVINMASDAKVPAFAFAGHHAYREFAAD